MGGRSESPALGGSSPEPEGASRAEAGTKRKTTSDGEQLMSKRAAKRKKKAPANDAFENIDEELQIKTAMGRMDGALLADHVARQTKRFEKDISAVELEDRRIPVSGVQDTSSWEGQRILDQLPSFIEQTSGTSREDLSHSAKAKGTPHTLVIASSGLRAADVTRALRVYQTKRSSVSKLFAKHIKLQEAIESTKQTRMNIGVGTPQRLLDLVDNDALSTKALTRIVVDASHVDQKKRGMLDMREILSPLIKFLTLPSLKTRYESYDKSSIKIIFF